MAGLVARGRARGYVLIAALALTFAMVLIALVIANLGRSAQGFAMITQGETTCYEAAQVAAARVLGALCGEADPSGLAGGGHPSSGASIAGKVGEVSIKGIITILEVASEGAAEGYPTTTSIPEMTGAKLPAQHASLIESGTVDGAPYLAASRTLTLYSRLYPYALLAPAGSVRAASLRSVRDPDGGDASITPVMACTWGRDAVAISGALNGRAYSGGTVTVGSGGIAYPSWPNPVDMPSDLTAQLGDFKSQATSGLSSDLDDLFKDWHDCLHADFSAAKAEAYGAMEARCLTEGGTLVIPAPDPYGGSDSTQPTYDSPGDTDYNSSGGTLTVGVSLRIGSSDKVTLSFSTVDLQADLLLDDGAILYVKGDLKVAGAIHLGKKSTLVVDGSTHAQTLNLTYSAPTSSGPLISSSLYGKGKVSIDQGMTQGTALFVPSIPSPKSNPYPSELDFTCLVPNDPAYTVPGSCPNPAALAFTAKQVECGVTAGKLAPHLGTVTAAPGLGSSVPGVLLLSDDALSIGGSTAAGLLVAGSGVSLSCSRLVGAAFASGGDVSAPSTDVRFYPYYTHAYGYTAAGARPVGAYLYHPAAHAKRP